MYDEGGRSSSALETQEGEESISFWESSFDPDFYITSICFPSGVHKHGEKILQRSHASNFYQPHNRNPVNFCYITFSRTVVVIHVFVSVWPLVARSVCCMGTEQWLHHPSPLHQSRHKWDLEHGPVLFILDWIWTGSQASDESSVLPVCETQSHDQPQVVTD